MRNKTPAEREEGKYDQFGDQSRYGHRELCQHPSPLIPTTISVCSCRHHWKPCVVHTLLGTLSKTIDRQPLSARVLCARNSREHYTAYAGCRLKLDNVRSSTWEHLWIRQILRSTDVYLSEERGGVLTSLQDRGQRSRNDPTNSETSIAGHYWWRISAVQYRWKLWSSGKIAVGQRGGVKGEVTEDSREHDFQQSHVWQSSPGSIRPRMTGPHINRAASESRKQTIANAARKILSVANALRFSEIICLAATNLYALAVEHKFTKGRKSMNVVAVCLYVACRQKETRNYMLIDFSDLLQVNVFELGHTYLQLVQTLNLRLPLVDPSHYISRFSALLEFGDETHKVATDAVRLVQRFDRDWMTRGRRPAGICGAALLLAARMNNFRRSVEEIVQVVKIADTTLKKRLDEFKNTPSGALTLADFRSVWLEDEVNPPAFTKGKQKEEAERLEKLAEEAGDEGEVAATTKPNKKRKGKRKRGESEDPEDPRQPLDPSIVSNSILADALDPSTSADHANIDPSLLSPTQTMFIPSGPLSLATNIAATISSAETPSPALVAPVTHPVEETLSNVLAEEVATFLSNPQGTLLSAALDEAEERRIATINADHDQGDDLDGLDEEELDRFLLTPEEVRIKERVWVELNRDYLEVLVAKGELEAENGGSAPKSRKRRKMATKPRDATTAAGETPAESVRNLIKKNPKYSKRINYDALKELFVYRPSRLGATNVGMTEDEKEDDGEGLPLRLVDEKEDDADISLPVIIEEEGMVATTPQNEPVQPKRPLGFDMDAGGESEEDADGDVDTGGWEDAYEQEL